MFNFLLKLCKYIIQRTSNMSACMRAFVFVISFALVAMEGLNAIWLAIINVLIMIKFYYMIFKHYCLYHEQNQLMLKYINADKVVLEKRNWRKAVFFLI